MKQRTTSQFRPRLAAAAAFALILAQAFANPPARAEEASFKGKTITMVIGSGAGGGIDLYGRVVARHIGKHIPGQPAVVAQNMPGAGSIAAANHLYNVAPKDGTAIGILSQGLILDEILRTPGLRFEVAKFNWIGRVSSDVLVAFTWRRAKVKTIADAITTEASLGGTGAGSSVTKSPKLLNEVVGTKFKVIVGYKNTGAAMLAMERGEVDGTSTGWGGLAGARPKWIKERTINMIVQFGTDRHPGLPDVPSWVEIAKTSQDKNLLRVFGANADIGKSIVAPPAMPRERVALLRAAFAAMLNDPAFLRDVKNAKMDFDHASGERLQKIVIDTIQVPEALRERARALNNAIRQK
ncbi:MAG: Bug family tripartite tricarboxylate transporter substrate binding protein [Xanthobacteraceae bacterium]